MKVLIVSNMFPNKKHPSAGIFVKKFCDEISKINIDYELSVMHKHNKKILKFLGYLKFYILTYLKIVFFHYDIVYVHYASHSSLPVLWALKLKKIAIFTNVHGSDVVPENSSQEKFQKFVNQLLNESKKIIVPSEYFMNYVSKKYSIDKEKITIYPSSGINSESFFMISKDEIKKIKREYSITNEKPTFCYVGRISTNKGWDIYLKAIAKLTLNEEKANFLVVGEGPEDEKYDNLMKSLGLDGIVIKYPLLSHRDLLKIYNISDAFVFPTKREGESLGLVALESMACGTPIISSNFAAPKYYVKDYFNGYKFPVGDVDSLSDIMSKFISREYLKEDLQQGCLETASEYNNDKVRVILNEIFEV